MSGHPGFYSVIRYCPVVARGEGVNVGVVVICPARGTVRVRLTENNDRVRRFFGGGDDARLASAKRALQHRLTAIPADEAALRTFISREAGHFVFDPLRRMVVTEDLEADVAALFDELVAEAPVHPGVQQIVAKHMRSSLGAALQSMLHEVAALLVTNDAARAALSEEEPPINHAKVVAFRAGPRLQAEHTESVTQVWN